MFRKLVVIGAAACLMSACGQPEQAAAPPPPPPTSKSFMVFFDLNSANLTTTAHSTLAQAAAAHKASGNTPMTATGHTDRSGPDGYNMELSVRRANSAKGELVKDGVPAGAITTIGRGESQPLVPTADGVVEPQNRRVEIVIGQGASPNDMAYCRELSVKYRRLLGMTQAQGDAADAMYQCEQGNTAAGIPVLEKYLTDAKIPLPPRT